MEHDEANVGDEVRPLLSVVVPVYNQAESIVANVSTIRQRVEAALGEPIELIVVSDGSVDRTRSAARERPSSRSRHPLRPQPRQGVRRQAGRLAARGRCRVRRRRPRPRPCSARRLLRRREGILDFVIGSKRHPDSVVHYPRSRRVGSWLYQQLVRVLFRLDVRDTQVGLKLFRREVVDEVMPLLLVKRFAFDLELLAVSRSLGFGASTSSPSARLPLHGLRRRSLAVLRALVDTAAIFYRLRILRYYQRKRSLLGEVGRGQTTGRTSRLSPASFRARLSGARRRSARRRRRPRHDSTAARDAEGEVVAFLEDGTPVANWLESTVPFLANPEIAAVVTASMTPARGSVRERAAAALRESFLGGGSLYFRFTPGNLRFLRHFPAENVVVGARPTSLR